MAALAFNELKWFVINMELHICSRIGWEQCGITPCLIGWEQCDIAPCTLRFEWCIRRLVAFLLAAVNVLAANKFCNKVYLTEMKGYM